MANGISILDRNKGEIPPAFSMWLDRTFPHLNGLLTIIKGADGRVTFEYAALDNKDLSEQDCALIRRAWDKYDSEKTVRQNVDLDPMLVQAISYIEGGYIVDAIICLADYQQSRIDRVARF